MLKAETEVMESWAKECQELLAVGGCKEGVLYWNLQKQQSCQHLDFNPMSLISDLWPPDLQDDILLFEAIDAIELHTF